MSGKLDQSLDEILSTRRKVNRTTGPRAAQRKSNGAATAPAGGIKKSVKAAKPTAKNAPKAVAPISRDSKIVVSGLPVDVNEGQIKEYFQKSVGSVKRVMITYNQHGVSRGIAQIYFTKADSAARAAKDLNGMLVDKKPMKIELVLDANAAPEPAPVKSLSDRVAANPKAQPKSATTDKAKDAAGRKVGRPAGRGRGRRGRAPGRPKKTAEELDQEMTDYMTGGPVATDHAGTSAPAATANGGEDLGMDEIS